MPDDIERGRLSHAQESESATLLGAVSGSLHGPAPDSDGGNREGAKAVAHDEDFSREDKGPVRREDTVQSASSKKNSGRKEQDGDQGDPSEKVFSLYVAKAEVYDRALVEGWKDDMDSTLIFAGLFSASVTAFLLQSYQALQPTPTDQTLIVLTTISQQLVSLSNSSVPNIPSPPSDRLPFQPARWALRVNVYWFLSLTLSLACALTATLVKQWGRRYLQEIRWQTVAYKRARIRTYLFEGLRMFKMPAVVEAIPTLLHASLLLFFIGLVEFLLPINQLLAVILLFFLGVGTILYAMTIGLPSYRLECPYQTPLSHMWWFLRRPLKKGNLSSARENFAMKDTDKRSERDDRALQWTVEQLSEDHELDPFIRALPDFVKSSKVGDGRARLRNLLEIGLEDRVLRMLQSCNNHEVLDTLHHKRVIGCIDFLWMSIRLLVKTTSFMDAIYDFTAQGLHATRASSITAALACLYLCQFSGSDFRVHDQHSLPIKHLAMMQPFLRLAVKETRDEELVGRSLQDVKVVLMVQVVLDSLKNKLDASRHDAVMYVLDCLMSSGLRHYGERLPDRSVLTEPNHSHIDDHYSVDISVLTAVHPPLGSHSPSTLQPINDLLSLPISSASSSTDLNMPVSTEPQPPQPSLPLPSVEHAPNSSDGIGDINSLLNELKGKMDNMPQQTADIQGEIRRIIDQIAETLQTTGKTMVTNVLDGAKITRGINASELEPVIPHIPSPQPLTQRYHPLPLGSPSPKPQVHKRTPPNELHLTL